MTKHQIRQWLYAQSNPNIPWLAECIECQYTANQTKPLMGLYNLSRQGRVGKAPTIGQVTIDGRVVPLRTLEKYA